MSGSGFIDGLCRISQGPSTTDNDQIYCNQTSNGVSCWPYTLGGHYAVIACPQDMHGIDPNENATRYCNLNGTWAEKANYSNCIKLYDDDVWTETKVEDSQIDVVERIIYNLGFSVSTLTLIIALVIFCRFRSLRCLRNVIHSHLVVTFIFRNLIWMLMHYSLVPIWNRKELWACKLLVSTFHYAEGTNFFWMLVEGLYLHIIVVWTYSADKIKKWYFLVIGWGLPLIFIIIWVTMRAHNKLPTQEIPTTTEDCWLPGNSETSNNLKLNPLDYIFIAPILFVLAVNLVFLGTIIWILITKLRASNSLETKQLRKAAKATVFLLPLLGITYVVLIWPPTNDPTFLIVHRVINAFLQAFQGFFVALFYCFLNGEVKSVVKKKFSRFHETRSFSTRKSSIVGMDLINKDSLPMTNGSIAISSKPYITGREPGETDPDKEEESQRMLV